MTARPIPPPGPGERDTFVDGVRWRSREAPGHGHPVVYVHGHLASSASWKEVLSAASAGRPAIAVDLPGFGFSDRPWPYDYTAAGEARGLARYLEARGIGKAVLVGNSLGGGEAMVVAAERPDLVEALVLVAPASPSGPIPWPVRILRVRGLGDLALALATRRFVGFGLRHRMYARAARVTEAAIDDAWRPLGVPGTRRAALQAIRTDPEAFRGLEARVRVPTLVLWGERDKMLPAAEGERLASKIRGARLVILPDAGHLPQRERPETFAAAVAGFVAELPAEPLSTRSDPRRAP
jgi:pimeloyl-ACP methyl ester carboxylesterase